MPKKSSGKRKSNRGRDLKHTETQAGIDVSRVIIGERGYTDYTVDKIAMSAVSPGLARKKPSTNRRAYMSRADIERGDNLVDKDMPDNLTVDKEGNVIMRTYFAKKGTK